MITTSGARRRQEMTNEDNEDNPSGDWMGEVERSIEIIAKIGDRLERDRRHVASVGGELMLIAQEAKLIRHVARIAYLNQMNHGERAYPSLGRWLSLVNVTLSEATAIADFVIAIPDLIQLSDRQIVQIADRCHLEPDSRRRFRRSTSNLRRYIQRWEADGVEPTRAFLDKDLSWWSFDRLHALPSSSSLSNSSHAGGTLPRFTGAAGGGDRRSASESGVDSGASDSGVGSNVSQNSLPTATPPASPLQLNAPSMSTPPPLHPWPTTSGGQGGALLNEVGEVTSSSAATAAAMMRSHSHDSNLQHSLLDASAYNAAMTTSRSIADCLAVAGGTSPTYHSSAIARGHTLSPPSPGALGGVASGVPSRIFTSPPTTSQFGTLPKSPKTGRMLHSIPHVWHKRTALRHLADNCQACQRPLGLVSEKCKSCKLKVHPQCTARIGNSCGLTPTLLRGVIAQMFAPGGGASGAWNDGASGGGIAGSRSMNEMAFAYPDPSNVVDSSSSTNSSAPSTPAPPLGLPSPYLQPPSSASMMRLGGASASDLRLSTGGGAGSAASSGYSSSAGFCGPPGGQSQHFTYPEIVDVPNINVVNENGDDDLALIESQGSDYTLGGRSSDGTLLTDSQGSTEVGGPSTAFGSNGGLADASATGGDDGSDGVSSLPGGYKWDRNKWNMFTVRGPNSYSSWSDVTIPFNMIEFGRNSLIGRGRFGEVHKGKYFGDVAVKLLNMDHVDEEQQVETFKQEVVSFKNTRHDNIILFFGYCIEKQNLAIVMNFCKGRPLHLILHESLDRLDFSLIVHFATQICQGISYLHTKKILHKDLRTKNIFIEGKSKVVITDFGLFNTRRLAQPDRPNVLVMPEFWLCYLAPELIRALSPALVQLPFSEASDVYAFGTVWFELITCEFPFRRLTPEAIVWQVGHGMKPALDNITAGREVKDVLMRCWKHDVEKRADFPQLLKALGNLPKKRLIRSPSYPAQLSRSHESMF